MRAEQLRQELKHKKQWDDLRTRNEAALSELEQLQVCSRKLMQYYCDVETGRENEIPFHFHPISQ